MTKNTRPRDRYMGPDGGLNKIAARNEGTTLVRNVLALHSVKRR